LLERHDVSEKQLSVNRWMVGDSDVVVINVVASQDIDCRVLLDDRSLVKLWNGQVTSNITQDSIV
jgi:hypothetical protein